MFARFDRARRHHPLVARRAGVRKRHLRETAWRPQLAILAVLTEFMRRRIDAGELRGEPQKLAMVFLGLVFMHALGRKKFPDSALHRGDPDEALRFLIDVFLNGVRNS